jgi:thiamine biosynthesis lipoprotein
MKISPILFLIILLISCNKSDKRPYQKLEGLALGTIFHITYDPSKHEILENEIDSLLYLVNKSMSTYIPNSDISKINRGDTTIVVDDLFVEVFNKSDRIYRETNGYFDPTVGIIVNAWGFGPGGQSDPIDTTQIKTMLTFVGFKNIKIEHGIVQKKFIETYIDFNAIAKGFAVDVLGRYLESNNIDNYMVEIGGEIRAKGINGSNKPWTVAIEKPNFDGSRSFQSVIELLNESIATSGNYRKFKIDSLTGEKYAHTMDPKTGFPSKSNLLSASVISKKDCADVDAYATALMSMGLEKSKKFLKKHPKLKAFLIYSEEGGQIKTYTTKNLRLKN